MVDEYAGGWTFLSNHARVLMTVARNPSARIREIGAACHITDRTAQGIIADLEQAGYLTRERIGRRTRYTVHMDGTFRHPTEAGLPIRALLELFTRHDDRQ
ncbi:helix-turn-helix transcriptional regulator [Streptomyces sp. NPDC048581]|uniref:helix-turn-helix transcriptional regulator n=1 Tax=unclassified Streptomyces TaxID=2593676 RepID=UPI003721B59B